MPFRYWIICATWEKVATFLEFVIKRKSPVGKVEHYVDDGTAKLGVPIASDKTEGPKTSIIYLGLE